MRTIHNYSLGRTRQPGHYGDSVTLNYRDKSGKHSVIIGAGTADAIDVFREGGETIVFSHNWGLDYCGVEIFAAGEKVGEMFLQSADDLEAVVGTDTVGVYSPITMAKRICQHIY